MNTIASVMPFVIPWKLSIILSGVTMPKSSGWSKRTWRRVRSTCRIFSISPGTCSGRYGTVAIRSASPFEPPARIQGNRRSKVVSGIATKASCDSPNILPFFSNTPITV